MDLLARLHSEQKELCNRINETGQFPEEDEKALADAISEFVDDFGPDFDEDGEPLVAGESSRVSGATADAGEESADGGDETDSGDSAGEAEEATAAV